MTTIDINQAKSDLANLLDLAIQGQIYSLPLLRGGLGWV
jgi:hypothetical protein